MKQIIGFIGAIIVLAAAIVAALLFPASAPDPRQISLPVTRMLACPVGDPVLGKTVIRLTDTEVFSWGLVNSLPSEPTTTAKVNNPESPIVVEGSATVGGFSTYTEAGKSMTIVCAPPIINGTWNGIKTQDMDATLILSNVDVTSAVVDVFLFGPTGPITMPGLRDIPVGASSTQLLSINQLLSTQAPISVTIRASQGRVSAVMRTITKQGVDWQHPQALPDTDLVLAGIPGGKGTRTVTITNPDTTTKATVTVQILGEMGSFTPPGLDTIEIPPSRTASVDMTQALGGQPSALQFTSDIAVTASIMVEDKDITGVSAQPALYGEIVLPPVGGTLWVANPGTEDATIIMQSVDEDGAPVSTTTPVAAQTQIPIEFPKSGDLVRIATSSDTVRTSLTLTDKSWSILPLTGGGIVDAVNVPALDPGLG